MNETRGWQVKLCDASLTCVSHLSVLEKNIIYYIIYI